MNHDLTKKQRWRFFLINVTTFAIVFFLLGFIVLHLLQRSAYQQTDASLAKDSQNQELINLEIERYQKGDPFLDTPNTTFKIGDTTPPEPRTGPESLGNNRFNTQMILWSEDGEILNKAVLGGIFSHLKNLTLSKNKLGQVHTLSMTDDQQERKLHFHSITVSYRSGKVAYVQLLANTDQIEDSLTTFKTILIFCMIAFWLLSIALSYYLSNLNMKPIILSWKKQQEFVENASHELRTPLTIIQNSLEHLFTKPNRTIIDESETIAQALNETRRLTGLTNDLLTIARSDANELVLDKTSVEVAPFLEELIKPYSEIAELEKKTLILHNEDAGFATFDAKKIHQVLVILLDNALKYTSTGDVIVITSKLNHREWLIKIQNTGPSISDEAKKHLFERFYREDLSRSKETGGYGLGLAIAKEIIEAHHGKIEAADLEPRGVIFSCTIPVKP